MSYSKNTDPDRMLKNLMVSGIEIPELSFLTKAHKQWIQESGEVVTIRPVVSGYLTVNTHLSELI